MKKPSRGLLHWIRDYNRYIKYGSNPTLQGLLVSIYSWASIEGVECIKRYLRKINV